MFGGHGSLRTRTPFQEAGRCLANPGRFRDGERRVQDCAGGGALCHPLPVLCEKRGLASN